ncbi:hypothetical protein D3C71_1558100 [compost metagenome]
MRLQDAGHGADGLVAGFVAEAVVDVLEVVDIDHRHRHVIAVAGQGQLALAVFKKAAAVGQAGEEIAGRQILQRANQLQLVHVLRHPAEEFFAREWFAQEVVGAVLQETRDQRRIGIS